MTSISYNDLSNYPTLREYLKGLYDKIIEGELKVSSGNEDFKTYHDLLFPNFQSSSSSITYTDKLTTSSSTDKGETTLNDKTISLKNLLTNTLDPTFNQTINSNTAPYTNYTNASLFQSGSGTKDHLCFIKLNSDSTNIEPDKYSITNILYSKYAIEIFIKIIDALLDCYSNHSKQFETNFTSSTQIYIVNRKLKNEHITGEPKGIYISLGGQDADSPPEGIYLYIGDLKHMFKDEDIKVVDKDITPIESKSNYLNSNDSIFKSNNKLQYSENNSGNTKYYFGYLEFLSNNASKYQLQSGTTGTIIINDVEGTMSGVNLNSGKITRTIINAGANITGLKFLENARITLTNTVAPVEAVPANLQTGTAAVPARPAVYTYKIITGSKISGTIAQGAIIKRGSNVENNSAINISGGSFTPTTAGSATKRSDTVIKPGSSITTTNDITTTTALVIPANGITLMSDITFTTSTKISIMGEQQTHIFASEYSPSDINISYPELDIGEQPVSLNNITIRATFNSLNAPPDTPQSFYKQNIYYIYNFIKMINNIDKDSFSPTIKYLRIYILCYKCLLLASIRAANIFYNNRYKLNAVAISYENDFIKKSTLVSGGTDCSKNSLNDFVKNDYKATFSTTSSCTAGNDNHTFPNDTDVYKYKYILYKKNTGETIDNNEIFKKYDVYLQQELGNIKNNKIKEATSSLGITNFKFFNSYKLTGNSFKITSDDSDTNDKYIGGVFQNSTPTDEYNIIKKLIDNRNIYEFNNGYRINIKGTSFKVKDFQQRNDNANNLRINIELEHNKDIPTLLYDNLNSYTTDTAAEIYKVPVYIVKITSKDIDIEYNKIVDNTDTVEENINMYKTKIKNNTTLYELHKSRNNLLYNQVLSYLIIVAVIISILVIINIANVEKPLIKSISLVCLAAVIILFMSYYIMNTLYIEEGFVEGSGASYTGYDLCPTTKCKKTDATVGLGNINLENSTDIQTEKKDYVKTFLETNAKDLIFMIILATPSIVNDSLKGNNEKLVAMSKNIYNEKLYLKDVLFSKKSDSEMNVDVLKYENKNYDVYIVCILFLALIMVGSYTINIYTDNKYMDLLILIMVILFVCLFTYFVLYTNRIVRTVSTNYYWGNEYENEYI